MKAITALLLYIIVGLIVAVVVLSIFMIFKADFIAGALLKIKEITIFPV